MSHVGQIGGAEWSLVDLVHALARSDSADLNGIPKPTPQLHVAVPDDGPLARRLAVAGAHVHYCEGLGRIPRRPSAVQAVQLLRGAKQLQAIVRDQGISIVHANSASAALFTTCPPWRVECPVVWTVRDLRLGLEARWLMAKTHRTIAPSRACASRLTKLDRHARVELIPNGIDTSRFLGITHRTTESFPFAVAIGHLVPWKNYDLLLDAVRIVRSRGVPLRVAVVGGQPFGDERQALEQWRANVAARGLSGVVDFVGAHHDVAEWLSRADLLLHSAHPEPFGRVVAEAMTAAVPVIAFSGAHGPAELLADGAGILVEGMTASSFAEAILRAVQDPMELRRIGLRARQKGALLYDRGNTSREVLLLYRNLLRESRYRIDDHPISAAYDRAGVGRTSEAAVSAAAPKPLHVLQVLEATAGGTRRYLRELVERVCAERYRFSIVCATNRDPGFRDDIDHFVRRGIEVLTLDMRREPNLFHDLRACRDLRRIIQQGHYDLVHLHSGKAGLIGRLATFDLAVPVLYTPHAFPFLCPGWLGRAAWLTERVLARRTSMLHAVSQAEARIAIESGWFGSRVAVVENAVDIARLEQLTTSHGGPVDRPTSAACIALGFLAELREQKDPLTFVEAARQLIRRGRSARFLMPAKGPLATRVRDAIRRHDLEAHFEFFPCLDSLTELHERIHLGVLPSRWEGLPFALLDAMALRIPVITSALPVFQDMLARFDERLLFRTGDATGLAERLDYWASVPPSELKALGERQREFVREAHRMADWEANVRAMYRALVREQPRTPQ